MVIRHLLSASLVVFVGTVIGRVAGFVRESLVAMQMGIGNESDLAVVLFSVPDLFIGLLLGGAFSAVFIPEFQKAIESQADHELYQKLSCIVALCTSAVSLGLSYWVSGLARILAPGFTDAELSSLSSNLNWAIWAFPFSALAGVTGAYLHAQNRFLIVAFGPLIFNSILILALIVTPFFLSPSITIFAISITLAAIIRWASQFAALGFKRSLLPLKIYTPPSSIRLNLVGKYLTILVSTASVQIMPYLARADVSEAGSGSIGIFNFAYKLVELPIAVIGAGLSAVLFPYFSQVFQRSRVAKEHFIISLQVVVALTTAAAFTLSFAAEQYVSFVFGWGGVTDADRSKIQHLFQWLLFSLPFQCVLTIFATFFNAINKQSTVLLVNLFLLVAFAATQQFLSSTPDLESTARALIISFGLSLVLWFALLYSVFSISFWKVINLRTCLLILILGAGFSKYGVDFAFFGNNIIVDFLCSSVLGIMILFLLIFSLLGKRVFKIYQVAFG